MNTEQIKREWLPKYTETVSTSKQKESDRRTPWKRGNEYAKSEQLDCLHHEEKNPFQNSFYVHHMCPG